MSCYWFYTFLEQGEYNHILKKIFLYLDGSSLKSSELVSWSWRRFVLEEIWENYECWKMLESGWRKGIPATRRLETGGSCVATCVDEVSIVCGMEDGRVDVYSRATLNRTHLLSGFREKITSLALDSRFIITGTLLDDFRITLEWLFNASCMTLEWL